MDPISRHTAAPSDLEDVHATGAAKPASRAPEERRPPTASRSEESSIEKYAGQPPSAKGPRREEAPSGSTVSAQRLLTGGTRAAKAAEEHVPAETLASLHRALDSDFLHGKFKVSESNVNEAVSTLEALPGSQLREAVEEVGAGIAEHATGAALDRYLTAARKAGLVSVRAPDAESGPLHPPARPPLFATHASTPAPLEAAVFKQNAEQFRGYEKAYRQYVERFTAATSTLDAKGLDALGDVKEPKNGFGGALDAALPSATSARDARTQRYDVLRGKVSGTLSADFSSKTSTRIDAAALSRKSVLEARVVEERTAQVDPGVKTYREHSVGVGAEVSGTLKRLELGVSSEVRVNEHGEKVRELGVKAGIASASLDSHGKLTLSVKWPLIPGKLSAGPTVTADPEHGTMSFGAVAEVFNRRSSRELSASVGVHGLDSGDAKASAR